ncbi:MAG: hypothetical protein ACREAY_04865 [Nitrososphaera sp.]|uniref:hypothetical protein n=1 Tax=Nitrososphaera sp. TaxID=1971748 RepID=UPI003D6EA21C
MVLDVKEVLYSIIDSIGRDTIRAEVSSNIDAASRRYSEKIISKCVDVLGQEADDETLGTLCEALLHFMLTASQLPSERKVTVSGIELDVVIPSTKSLAKDPARAIVIQVIKAEGDMAKIRQAEQVQPRRENVWTVSAKSLMIQSRNYNLADGKFKYPSLISDIHAFLADRGISSLKMFHG